MKKFRNMLIVLLAAVLLASGLPITSFAKELPSTVYFTDDAFKYVTTKKGVQGYDGAEVKEVSNVFVNVFMETAFIDDKKSSTAGYESWDYNGKTYYFKTPEGAPENVITELNARNITVTAQLLLRYDKNKERLIEPTARKGYADYYAPNVTDAAVVEEYKAFIDFMTYKYGSIFCHIDAYVVGNEVNAAGTWNYFGTSCMSGSGLFATYTNKTTAIDKYATFYNLVYDGIKKHNPGTRVCVCVDHSWNESAGNTRIPVKEFLNSFNSKAGEREWNLAYHCYPSGFDNPKVWSSTTNKKTESAAYVDGYNLEILTGYVKSHFGSEHRILLTEQGFSNNYGSDAQAAGLTYTYYKAKFDDMVDVMHVMKFKNCGYELDTKAAQIWSKLDNGSDADEQWILDQVKGTIGIKSFADITSNWKKESELQAQRDLFKADYGWYWSGIDLSPVFDYMYYEGVNKSKFSVYYVADAKYKENVFSYFTLYDMKEQANGNTTFDPKQYKSDHLTEIPAGLTEKQQNMYAYVLYSKKATMPDEVQVRAFCTRLYTECLVRIPDREGIDFWTDKIVNEGMTGAEVGAGFVFSDEYDKMGTTKTEYIKMLYRLFMGREGDAEGIEHWKKEMYSGKSREYVFKCFVESPEYKGICKGIRIKSGNYTETGRPDPVATKGVVTKPINDYVERIYVKALDRGSDPEGIEFWAKQIANEEMAPTAVAEYFIISPEFEAKKLDDTEYMKVLYRTFMGREYDKEGLDYWLGEIKKGATRKEILNRFASCPEFQDIIKSFGL